MNKKRKIAISKLKEKGFKAKEAYDKVREIEKEAKAVLKEIANETT